MTLWEFIIIAVCTVVALICSVSFCRKQEKKMANEYIKTHKAEYEKMKEAFNQLLEYGENKNDNA